jgi:hypothetical protein
MPPKTIAASRPLPIGNASTHCFAGRRYQRLSGSSGGGAAPTRSPSSLNPSAWRRVGAVRHARRHTSSLKFMIPNFPVGLRSETPRATTAPHISGGPRRIPVAASISLGRSGCHDFSASGHKRSPGGVCLNVTLLPVPPRPRGLSQLPRGSGGSCRTARPMSYIPINGFRSCFKTDAWDGQECPSYSRCRLGLPS